MVTPYPASSSSYHYYKSESDDSELIFSLDILGLDVTMLGGMCYRYETEEYIYIPSDFLEGGPTYFRVSDEFMTRLEPGMYYFYISSEKETGGMGNIGRKVASVAKAFGCRVIFYSASGKSTCTDYEQVDFDTLLKESDILSLHCPLTDRTRNLIDLEAMKKMKKSAVLINVARGPVVNNADLYTALLEEEIAGAGLDVVEKEPIAVDNPLNKIKDSGKLIITPHIGWASVEARTRCVEEAYKNVEAFLKGESRNVVNE